MKMSYKKAINEELAPRAASYYLETFYEFEIAMEDIELVNLLKKHNQPTHSDISKYELISAIVTVSHIYNKPISKVVNDVNAASANFDINIVDISWFV